MESMRRFIKAVMVAMFVFNCMSCLSMSETARKIEGTSMYIEEGEFGEPDLIYHKRYYPGFHKGASYCKIYIRGKSLRMSCSFTDVNWIFFDRIDFSLDGRTETFSVSRSNKTERVEGRGVVYESASVPVSMDFLSRLSRAKNIDIRFSGREYYKTCKGLELQTVAEETLEYYRSIK